MEELWTALDVLIYSGLLAFVVMCFWMFVDWSWSLADQNDKILFYVLFTAFAIVQVFVVIAKDSIVV